MSNINDSFNYTRFDKIFAKSMHFEQNGTHSPPFSQNNTSIPCHRQRKPSLCSNQQRKKGTPDRLFSAKFGAKMTSLFAMYTMLSLPKAQMAITVLV
jgi:hypothetical protein